MGLRCWYFSFFCFFFDGMEWRCSETCAGWYSMVRLLSFRLLPHVLADGLHVLENYLALVVG